MTETTSQKKLRPTFWESVPLNKMTDDEWEALCDGCGRCCLNKLEDPDTGHVALTRIACRLLDNESCRCAQYDIRHQFVPECIRMTSETIAKHAYWLPNTCAYKLLHRGEKTARLASIANWYRTIGTRRWYLCSRLEHTRV